MDDQRKLHVATFNTVAQKTTTIRIAQKWYAEDVAIVDIHTAVIHASFLVTRHNAKETKKSTQDI